MAARLGGRLTGETLVEAQVLQDALLAARRALDPEPCGRAVSQMATCPKPGKIVLFGGCTFDGFLADTWVYDCKTRSWEQRYPKIAPAPRGGHVLAWLPKAEKVVLFGSEKFTNILKKRKKVFFEIAPEEGFDEYATETVKMFDDEGAQIGKLTYADKGDMMHVTHFHIDLWEEKQDFALRFIKWFEGYARKKKAKTLRIEVFERDAKTYDLVTILRASGFSPTATGFMKGRTSYELQKKL